MFRSIEIVHYFCRKWTGTAIVFINGFYSSITLFYHDLASNYCGFFEKMEAFLFFQHILRIVGTCPWYCGLSMRVRTHCKRSNRCYRLLVLGYRLTIGNLCRHEIKCLCRHNNCPKGYCVREAQSAHWKKMCESCLCCLSGVHFCTMLVLRK